MPQSLASNGTGSVSDSGGCSNGSASNNSCGDRAESLADEPARPTPLSCEGPSSTPSPGAHHQQQPQTPASSSKQLAKLKRFLNTLVQFGSDISLETGQRVRELVLSLVNSSMTIEQFHAELQSVTNFPLRPFVIPFLKASLPLLQLELTTTPGRESPAAETGRGGGGGGRGDSLMRVLSSEPAEAVEAAVGQQPGPGPAVVVAAPLAQKRRFSEPERLPVCPPVKRRPVAMAAGSNSPPLASSSSSSASAKCNSSGQAAFTSAGATATAAVTAATAGGAATAAEEQQPRGPEDWRHVDAILSAIVDLVGKARRSMAGLQQQQQQQQQAAAASASSSMATAAAAAAAASPHLEAGGRRQSAAAARRVRQQQLQFDGLVAEVRHQAQQEVRLAVAIAEEKAGELIAMEKLRTERLLAQTREQAREEALGAMRVQSSSIENCWNCGRLASETCSGCSTARYCGNFCQHKDWERHQKVCGLQLINDSLSSMSRAKSERN